MIVHVSPRAQNYSDTLTTLQLASRIHRMRRRRIKFVSAAAGNGSGGSSGRYKLHGINYDMPAILEPKKLSRHFRLFIIILSS